MQTDVVIIFASPDDIIRYFDTLNSYNSPIKKNIYISGDYWVKYFFSSINIKILSHKPCKMVC
jgi:hypothetical protein